MRKSLLTEAQVIGILKRAEAGQPVTELCREHGITQQTFYRWRRKFGGMEVFDAQELNRLLDENRRLKHLVAELALDNRILKDVLGKKSDAARCAAPERAASTDAAEGRPASSMPSAGLFTGVRALSDAEADGPAAACAFATAWGASEQEARASAVSRGGTAPAEAESSTETLRAGECASAVQSSQSALVARFHAGQPRKWTQSPAAQRHRRLHQGVSVYRGVDGVFWTLRDEGAGATVSAARPSRDDSQRQRTGVCLGGRTALGPRQRHQVALYRTRKADAELPHRELQWEATRRVLEPKSVARHCRGATRNGAVQNSVQHRAPQSSAAVSHTIGVRTEASNSRKISKGRTPFPCYANPRIHLIRGAGIRSKQSWRGAPGRRAAVRAHRRRGGACGP